MSSVYTVYMTYRMKTIYFQVKVHINSQTLNGNSWFSENPSCVQNTDLVLLLDMQVTYKEIEEEPLNCFLFAETGWVDKTIMYI